ncbi:MAG: ThiF family adenylyltransferase [Pseudomonadota bacterium]
MPLTKIEIEYYSQQIKLNEVGLQGQERLKNAHVLCVGAGGLSAPLLLYLAAAGIGTIGIIDADEVEMSNLHRQVVYRHTHLGRPKTAMAKEQLLALNPYIKINLYQDNLTPINARKIIQRYHIIADCTDNFATRYLINDVCYYLNKPYLFASVQQFQGQCSLFLGSSGPCLRCLFPVPPKVGAIPNCGESGIVGVVPGLLGTLQATEIIKWILQQGQSLQGKLLMVDMLTMQFRQFFLKRNPECKLCVYRKPIKELLKSAPVKIPHGISASRLREKLQKQKNIILIDVRSPEERSINNPLGGQLIPLASLASRLPHLDTNKSIVVYCHSSFRSQEAVRILIRAGFSRIKFLLGGLIAWQKTETCKN